MTNKILAFTVATAVAGMAQASDKIVIDGSTTVGPIAKAFAEYYMTANPDVNITVSESGSGNGAKSMMNGTCDIAIMSRPMKESEFKAAAKKGIQPVAHVVSLDGLPILIHPSNPVQDLTVEQIRKIYLGEISNWKQVGGPDKAIVTISRDTNSGTYETFAKLVMSKQKIHENCEYVGSNGAIRQRVQSTPAAIGYAGLGFVDKTVKAVKVNGIYPSAETVQTGDYPIARPLFMYTNTYPKLGLPLYRFCTIHLTEDGQEMVEEIGFVPVTAY
jgi:phosphate transport system substrate-binding protein